MAEPEADDVPGVPEWVVTYGDMMSLLLTFFIMLVSMSQMKTDNGKTRAALDAIREVFGPTQGKFGAPGRSQQSTSELGKRNSSGKRAEGGTKVAGQDSKGAAGAHKAGQRISDGTTMTLGGPARFDPYDARLTDALKKNLDIIAGVLRPKPNRIIVRGHATPEPIPSHIKVASAVFGASTLVPEPVPGQRVLSFDGLDVRDQFDLSYARARAVADYLVSKRIPRERIRVSAAGDTEPRLQTRRETGQAMNRRVDVFLVDSYISPRKRSTGR